MKNVPQVRLSLTKPISWLMLHHSATFSVHIHNLRNRVTNMNANNGSKWGQKMDQKEWTQKSNGSAEIGQDALNFYNLATSRLLSALEVNFYRILSKIT